MKFSMETLGENIAKYRKQAGMTQTELADRLGLSFQAVSNWERGQSCPDIANLVALAQLFGVSVDTLLGNSAEAPQAKAPVYAVDITTGEVLEPNTATAADEADESEEAGSPDDISRILPLLDYMDEDAIGEIAMKHVERTGAISMIVPLLDYMDEDTIGEIAQQFVERTGAISTIIPLLDYMDEDAIGEIALHFVDKTGDLDAIQPLLDYMDEDAIGELAELAVKQRENGRKDRRQTRRDPCNQSDSAKPSLREIAAIAPFTDRKLLEELVRDCVDQGSSLQDVGAVAPFVSRSVLDELVRKNFEKYHDLNDVAAIAPFVSPALLEEIAEQCIANGGSFSSVAAIAPFLPKSVVDRLVRNALRKKDTAADE